MRNQFAILILIAVTLLCLVSAASGTGFLAGRGYVHPVPESQVVVQRYLKMKDFITAGLRDSLYGFLVYRGTDETRRWKDVWDLSDPTEKKEADEAINDLFSLFQNLKKSTLLTHHIESESEGEWHVVTARMKYTSGKPKNIRFAFLLVKGKYRLGDVDD